MTKIYLSDANFEDQKTLEQLAKCIGIEEDFLKKVAKENKEEFLLEENREFHLNEYCKKYNLKTLIKKHTDGTLILAEPNSNTHFQKHKIPKKRSTKESAYRVVWEALPPLADAYKSFNRRFDLFARRVDPRYPRFDVYGYIKGKNTYNNAHKHCGSELILHADIKDFFPSISLDRIKRLFRSYGIQETVLDVLANFVTIEGRLPLGLHPSPMLSNLVCLSLDEKLAALSNQFGCIYTRYADDITISGNEKLPSKKDIQIILREEGFSLAEKKFKITKCGQAHFVTGLSVNGDVPRVPKTMKKKLRQELYYCDKFGIRNHLKKIDGKSENYVQHGVNRIDGYVRYVSYIEETQRFYIRELWRKLLIRDELAPSYPTAEESPLRFIELYADETEFEIEGDKFLALCIVEMSAPSEKDVMEQATNKILDDYMADRHMGGKKQELAKKKLHWVDMVEDLRNIYSEKLASLPFKSYISFARITEEQGYSDAYIRLLKELLPYRLKASDRSFVTFVFEENSKVSFKKIDELFNKEYDVLKKSNGRRPENIRIGQGAKKDHPCISVPDALLGIFRSYALLGEENRKRKCNGKKETDRPMFFFEKIRDKIRVIKDVDNNILYSRRKEPFKPL